MRDFYLVPHHEPVEPPTKEFALVCGRGFGKTWTSYFAFMYKLGFKPVFFDEEKEEENEKYF